MTGYGVVLFHTTSAVMKAEKLLIAKGYTIKLIPPPREFSSDCGIAIRFVWTKRESIELDLKSLGLETGGIHQMP
jgi:hypothetical protein